MMDKELNVIAAEGANKIEELFLRAMRTEVTGGTDVVSVASAEQFEKT